MLLQSASKNVVHFCEPNDKLSGKSGMMLTESASCMGVTWFRWACIYPENL